MARVHRRRSAVRWRTHSRSLALALTGLLALASQGRADVVHLIGGTELTGKVVEETADKVVIELTAGTMQIPRSRVKAITRSADGDYGREKGPSEPSAASGPTEADRRRQHELDQRARVGPGARTVRSAHWTLVTNADRKQERELIDLLEDSWRRFHAESYRLGLRPRSINDRLECLYFTDEAVYDAALVADGVDPAHTGIAQVAAADQLYVVHEGARAGRLAAQVDAANVSIAECQAERDLAAAGKMGDDAPTTEEYEARLDGLFAARETLEGRHRRALAPLDARQVSRSAAAQIAFAKGVLDGQEPRWIWDGILATLELTDHDDAGRTGPNPLLLATLQKAWAAGHHTRLLDIVEGEPREDVELGRAEAWSLVRYLGLRHTRAFAKHVRTRTSVQPDSGLVQDSLEHLRRDLGVKLSGVDEGWRRFVRDGAK